MKINKISPKTFSPKIFQMKGISKKTIEEHLKLYQGYVNKYNEIQERLVSLTDDDFSKANQIYSTVRELKTELSFAWGGVVNHEIYFEHLGGTGQVLGGTLLKQIEKDFGSFEVYKKDVKASAMAARGWVWTVWNKKEKRLFNHLGDNQNTYSLWFSTPILAIDTYEHAYFIDFGTNRSAYIDAFFLNLNWETVEKNLNQATACDKCRC